MGLATFHDARSLYCDDNCKQLSAVPVLSGLYDNSEFSSKRRPDFNCTSDYRSNGVSSAKSLADSLLAWPVPATLGRPLDLQVGVGVLSVCAFPPSTAQILLTVNLLLSKCL